jgi:hypothetical protein
VVSVSWSCKTCLIYDLEAAVAWVYNILLILFIFRLAILYLIIGFFSILAGLYSIWSCSAAVQRHCLYFLILCPAIYFILFFWKVSPQPLLWSRPTSLKLYSTFYLFSYSRGAFDPPHPSGFPSGSEGLTSLDAKYKVANHCRMDKDDTSCSILLGYIGHIPALRFPFKKLWELRLG